MFISKDSEGIFVVLMCVALVLVLFSTVGCGGRLRQQLKECASLKEQCESDKAQLEGTLQDTETELKNAENKVEELTQNIDTLQKAMSKAELKCSNDLKQCQEQIERLKSDLENTESERRKFRNERDNLTRDLKYEKSKYETLNSDLKQCQSDAKEAAKKADKQLEKVKAEKIQVEDERDYYKELAKHIPQAEIITDTVRFHKDRIGKVRVKHGIRIEGQFRVSNRKGHKMRAVAYFYREDGSILKDYKGRNNYVHKNQQIAVLSKEFHIDYVNPPKNERFNLFIPFDELQVGQKHKLRFTIRIYDESTQSYLENAPHEEKFEYDLKGEKIKKMVD